MDILVRRAYTQRQIDRANTGRVEFRPSRYTSGVANLDNMVELRKAVILCDSHARKFDRRKARYEPHPDPNMRRVQGNCDVCKMFGLASLFLHESLALDERRKFERYRTAVEYGKIVTG